MLCGASPIPASSGKTVRHRLNRGGNRQANTALYRIVVVRLRWHQPTRDYLARRTKEGLSKREIIRCLKRYVAREVFSALQAPTALAAPLDHLQKHHGRGPMPGDSVGGWRDFHRQP
jgi:transposase